MYIKITFYNVQSFATLDIVEAITPQKLITLRNMLNSSAMDIMYYTSPLYGEEVNFSDLRNNLVVKPRRTD